jgi:hypothetical protein
VACICPYQLSTAYILASQLAYLHACLMSCQIDADMARHAAQQDYASNPHPIPSCHTDILMLLLMLACLPVFLSALPD